MNDFSKLLVEDERHKCDPACSPGFLGRYARESLLWLKLKSERGVGSSSWVESLAKERWGVCFADSDPCHDTQWQDCRADLEEQMETVLIPHTRAWARAFMFGETTDGVLQYAPSISSWAAASRSAPLELREFVETCSRPTPG